MNLNKLLLAFIFACFNLTLPTNAQVSKPNAYAQNRSGCLEMLKAEAQEMSANNSNSEQYTKIAQHLRDGIYSHCRLSQAEILSAFSPPHRSQIEVALGTMKDQGFLNPDASLYKNQSCKSVMGGVLHVVDITIKQPSVIADTWITSILNTIHKDKQTYARCQTSRSLIIQALNKYYLYQRNNQNPRVETPLLSSLHQTINLNINNDYLRNLLNKPNNSEISCLWGLEKLSNEIRGLFSSSEFDVSIWTKNANKAEAILQSIPGNQSLLSYCRATPIEVQTYLFAVYAGQLELYAPDPPHCTDNGSRCVFQKLD